MAQDDPHRICRRSLNALANAMRRRLARNTTKTPSRGQPIRAVTSTSPQRNGPSTIAPWRRGKNVGGEDRTYNSTGYRSARASQAQAEPADDGGRYCDRAAGAQAEEARAVAC